MIFQQIKNLITIKDKKQLQKKPKKEYVIICLKMKKLIQT